MPVDVERANDRHAEAIAENGPLRAVAEACSLVHLPEQSRTLAGATNSNQ
jgi:hypothetical protein